MTREELEEALDELFPGNYHLTVNKKGRLTIVTTLLEDEFGELVNPDESEEDGDFETDGEEEPYVEDDSDE